jgi:D-sedoheptulose 7-phosphate isomerase
VYLERLTRVLAELDRAALDRAVDKIRQAWQNGRQIITFGNGGSALTALHFIADWNKSVPLATGRVFRGRTLVDNVGLLTAYANDVSFEEIFREQLRNLAEPGDLVVAISGSGNSENVIRGVLEAHRIGCESLALCGMSGGRLRSLAQTVLWAQIDDMQLSEDVHAIFGHIVVQTLTAEATSGSAQAVASAEGRL